MQKEKDPDVLIPIVGDLLRLPSTLGVTHVVQQLNCVSIGSKGLSFQIARKWPWADIYSTRTPMSRRPRIANDASRGVPGTIVLSPPPPTTTQGTSPGKLPVVVGLYGQWDVGGPSSKRSGRPTAPASLCRVAEGDSSRNRIVWFKQALEELGAHLESADSTSVLPVVAFPYKIGCGLARGNWDVYRNLINKWSLKYGIKTYIVARLRDKPQPGSKRKRTRDDVGSSTKRSKALKPKG